MRRKITTVVTVLSLLAAFMAPSMASAAPTASAKTQISGTVTNTGKPVKKAHVSVVCNSFARTAETNSAGQYVVTFKPGQCPAAASVTVVATKKGYGGVSHGTVSTDTLKLNVAIVNVTLPEFGLFTGAGAAVAAGAGFLVIRRRQVANVA